MKLAVEVRDGIAMLGTYRLFSGDSEALLDALDELSDLGRRAFIATPNVDHVIELERNRDFAAAYDMADICPTDGAPLVALARLLGARDVHRLTGADLLGQVCSRAAASGKRVVIAGGSDATLSRAVENLKRANPGVSLNGLPFPVLSGPGDPASAEAVDELRVAQPDFVFLCLGTPKQELWFARWAEALPPAVYIGSGAAVDFAAGTVRRAPGWVQRAGGEWLWRLAREPRRLAHRYLVRGPLFIPVIARSVGRRLRRIR